MSFSPVSSDWFKNMALFSISRSLTGKSNVDTLLPTGDLFSQMMQSALIGQEYVSSNSFPNVTHSINSFPMIKDYSNVLDSQANLSFIDVAPAKFESSLKGKLSGTGEAFIEAGRKYNLNPTLLASIAIHETGNGKSQAAHEKQNIAGMMGKNGLKQYNSVEESIFDMARNLRENYVNQGIDNIPKIGAKYAPMGAANDPTGLNNHWVKGVNSYFHSLT